MRATASARTASGNRHICLMPVGRGDPEADAHTLLAALSADHVRAVMPELGQTRIRRAALTLVDALAPN
ncbi:hypothetical protein GCM10009609_57180 [Pseudonocardia aurantiaca]